MSYEILNSGKIGTMDANIFCYSKNTLCVNGLCVNGNCGCSGNTGNVYPCANPGFGCRNGCGGASSSMCVRPWSLDNSK